MFIKLYDEMPIPVTSMLFFFMVAFTAFDLLLVREMGRVKEMSRKLVKRWMGQVKRKERREIRCLMPFGIKFGSEMQRSTALTYLLLISKSAKWLILIG